MSLKLTQCCILKTSQCAMNDVTKPKMSTVLTTKVASVINLVAFWSSLHPIKKLLSFVYIFPFYYNKS